MKKSLVLSTLLAAFTFQANAADLAAGKALAEAQCAACHAANNDWNKPIDATYPKLAGQHKDYLAVTLRGYKSGERVNGIMNGMAAGLSSEDIANVSAYLASLEGDLYLKK